MALSRVPTLLRVVCVVHILRRGARERISRSGRLRPGVIVDIFFPNCGLLFWWLRGMEGSNTLVVGLSHLLFFCRKRVNKALVRIRLENNNNIYISRGRGYVLPMGKWVRTVVVSAAAIGTGEGEGCRLMSTGASRGDSGVLWLEM